MRTTLDIDDDVLETAREIARREGRTAGRVVSDLLRRALTQSATSAELDESDEFLGFLPFAPRARLVTDELIDRLRDDGEY